MPDVADSREFTRVASVDEFVSDRGRMVFYKGTRVAVFRQDDKFYAVNDRCPHMGAAMSGGRVVGGVIRCHMHGWEFSVSTGECKTKEWARLPCYEVKVEGNDLFLRPIVDKPDSSSDDDLDSFMNWDKPAGDNGDS